MHVAIAWLRSRLKYRVHKYCRLFGVGDTFTSGFPSLDEIQGNGSLLNDGVYSTHDGEERSVPGLKFTCDGRIVKVAFIALPGIGIGTGNAVFTVVPEPNNTAIIRSQIRTSIANLSFGDFGYELTLSDNMQSMQSFRDGDTLRIRHPISSHRRILHQRGDKELVICWRLLNVPNYICGSDYDYPLLAVETGMKIAVYSNLLT